MNSNSSNLLRAKKIEILKALRSGNAQPLLNLVDETEGCDIRMELGELIPVPGGYKYCGELIDQNQLSPNEQVKKQSNKHSRSKVITVDMQL